MLAVYILRPVFLIPYQHSGFHPSIARIWDCLAWPQPPAYNLVLCNKGYR